MEGYGLSWSYLQPGRLLSGSDDKTVCLWDMTEAGAVVEPLRIFGEPAGHSDVVEDVDWSRHIPDLFGSVGDDGQLLLWDVRDGSTGKPKHAVQSAHGEHEVRVCVVRICICMVLYVYSENRVRSV